MTTPTTHPPEETPAAIARTIAQLATAPVHDFVSCISDDDNTRDHLYQRLGARLTDAFTDEPGAWSRAREDDVDAQLRAALATTEAKDLFGQYVNNNTTRETIRQEAAFLLGVEVGRRVTPPSDDGSGAALDIDLIDRADRVRTLLEFVAGYALLVDACEDGATIDSLKMSFLGIPLLEASELESGGAA